MMERMCAPPSLNPSPCDGDQPGLGPARRPVLIALASSAAAVTGLGVASRSGILSGAQENAASGFGGQGVLQLAADDMGVETLRLPLDNKHLTRVAPGRWRSARLATTTHSMVGVTWRRGEPEPDIDVSSRVNGTWQPWRPMPRAHDAPDPDSDEVSDIVGTDLAWVGPADGIRLRVRDNRPAGFTLVLLYPVGLRSDNATAEGTALVPAGRTGRGIASSAKANANAEAGAVPRPQILSRADWGADEDLRERPPQYADTIRQVHVHHTANSNTYHRKDVPALIRGMYAYHTRSLGWSDLGYNFLVDRFGRIWNGRAGGPGRPVRGAHTLGFNASSTGVAAIGNFDTVEPPIAVLAAIARVAAWKLDRYDRHPLGRTTVTSEGSDKYRTGRKVRLPVIDGHRDTNDTACPGRHLYAALPAVRRRTKRRMDRYAGAAQITKSFAGTGAAIEGKDLFIRPGTWTPAETVPNYTWMRDGAPIAGSTAARHRLEPADVGSHISARVTIAVPRVEPAKQTISFDRPVRAQPVLAVKTKPRRGRAVVRVRATAASLAAGYPTGNVIVTLGGRTRSLPLADGRLRTVFQHLKPGTYHVQVTYPGNGTAAPATASATVRVAAPKG